MNLAGCCTSMRCRRRARSRVDAGALGADLMTLSAHKFGGPKGAGALIVVREGLPVAALLAGGGQERGYRAGTENVAAIAGFGAAAEAAARDLPATSTHCRTARCAGDRNCAHGARGCGVFRRGPSVYPIRACFAVPGMQAETLFIALDLDGVAVSAGSACSSGKVARSHVLEAMGVAPELSARRDPGEPGVEYGRGRCRALRNGLEYNHTKFAAGRAA